MHADIIQENNLTQTK